MYTKEQEKSLALVDNYLATENPEDVKDIMEDFDKLKLSEVSADTYFLNFHESFNGLPVGEISMLSDNSTPTRSIHLASSCSHFQNIGYQVIVHDSNGSLDDNLISQFNINLNSIHIVNEPSIEDFNLKVIEVTSKLKDVEFTLIW